MLVSIYIWETIETKATVLLWFPFLLQFIMGSLSGMRFLFSAEILKTVFKRFRVVNKFFVSFLITRVCFELFSAR